MKKLIGAAVAASVVALAGCGKEGTSTAPPKPESQPSGNANERRKLVVKAPGEQNVTRGQTTEFSVSIDRENFAGAVDIELRNLPSGVSMVTKDRTIPAGQDSLKFTIKAEADATVAEDHKVTVAAKAQDMPEAITDFKLDVKAKK